MIRAKIEIDEINYENLVTKLIPVRWLHPIAKVGLQFIKPKDSIMLHMFSKYKALMIDKINTYSEGTGFHLSIRDAELNQVEKDAKDIFVLSFNFDEINYKQIIEKLLPMIIESLSKREDKQGEFIRYLAGMGSLPLIMSEAALSTISQRTKDEMITAIINIYQEDVVKAVNRLLTENEITSEISSLYAEVLPL